MTLVILFQLLISAKFLRGFRSDSKEIPCDCCFECFRTQKDLDEHINKGCYPKNTGKFQLSKENEFFHSENCCPINPFSLTADTETEMRRYIGEIRPRFRLG